MGNSIFDYLGNLDTLLAVILGAVLATFGALIAESIQERRNRKRRERDAARFFGDILTSLDHILEFTFQSQEIGDPWGPMTMRLFKTAMRETEVYERNRERLFDIQDMGLRSRIHIHFLTETFPLEALIENCERISEIEEMLERTSGNKAVRLQVEIDNLRASLTAGLSAIKREASKTSELCADLEKIAKVKFAPINSQTYSDSVRLPE